MQKILLILIAIFEGILLSLSLPNIEIGILPFIALIPSLFIIKHTKTYKGAFFLGWLSGIITLLMGFNWLVYTIDTFAGSTIPDWAIYPLFFLYCAVFSLKFPLFHLLTKYLNKKLGNNFLIIIFPVVLTVTEFIIPELFPFYFGNFFYKDLWILQIAEITGMSGLTFLMGLSSVLIFTIISFFFPKLTKTKKKSKFPIIPIFISIVFLISVHVYGFIRIQFLEAESNMGYDDIKIGLIQPNTPMPLEDFENNASYNDKKINDSRISYSRRKCIQLTLEILRKYQDIDIIIWPESGVPSFVYKNPRNANEIKYKSLLKTIINKYSIYLYINDFDIEYTEEEKKGYYLYNNSDLISPDGEIVNSYRKIYLLPFGEYDPFKNTFIQKLFPELSEIIQGSGISNASPGDTIKTLNFKKWTFAPQVCYETIIPSFTRLFTSLDTDFIINTTNDRWFGKSKASMQHLILAIPRAIENRMYLIRSTNSGISAIISPTGKYVKSISKSGEGTTLSPLFEQDYIIANIKTFFNINTFYKSYGDVFGWIILIIMLSGLIFSIILSIANKSKKNKVK